MAVIWAGPAMTAKGRGRRRRGCPASGSAMAAAQQLLGLLGAPHPCETAILLLAEAQTDTVALSQRVLAAVGSLIVV